MTSDTLATLKINDKIEINWGIWRIASYLGMSPDGMVRASRNGIVMEFDLGDVRLR